MRYKKPTGGRHAARISAVRKPMFMRLLSVVLCVLLFFFFLRIDAKIRPIAEKICLYECRSLTARIVAESTADALETVSVMDLSLTTASYDENGCITGIQTNAAAINTVQTVLLEALNSELERQRNDELSVHLGTLTGLHLLTGRGAEIPLRYVPKGSAEVELKSTFTSAGINQTIHTLTAEITIHAGCSVPLYQADTAHKYSYLMAETVIVGDVPAVNWNTKNLPAV